MGILTHTFICGLLAATVRVAAPLLLAALGSVFTAKAGIVNLALEGTMLLGAFAGYYGSYFTGSVWGGILFAIAGGIAMQLLLAFFAVTVGANQSVAGTGINMFSLGLTTYLLTVMFGISGRPSIVASFKKIKIPFLSQIPYAGTIFFDHQLLVYLAYLCVPVCWYVLFKTPFGLKVRAVGEHPKAVDIAGGSVVKIRYTCCVIAGVLAGIGGAYLSIGELASFTENLTSGRGYIAVAAVTFGKWNPIGVMMACLLFGFTDALQMRLQSEGVSIPPQFLLMLPYFITMIAMVVVVGKTKAPASMGKPYVKHDSRN